MEIFVAALCLIGLVLFVRWLMPGEGPPPPTEIEAPPMSVAEAAAKYFPGQMPTRGTPGLDVEPRRRAVRAALKNLWKMTIVYVDEHGERTERTIYPLHMRGDMHLRARCELRQGERTFRLDRMQAIEVHAARQDARARYRVS